MWFRRDKQGQRKNRRKPAVEYGRRNVLHDKDDFGVTFAASDYEAVHNVRAKVDAQSDTDDKDVHGRDVYGEAPPMHET